MASELTRSDKFGLVLDFVSESLFFAAVLLVPGTIALYQDLIAVDRTKAAAGCGIIAITIPVIAVTLIIHGRLIYPIYGMRVDTPEAAALVVMVFYGGLHAVYLLLAVATIVLSLAIKRRLPEVDRVLRVRHRCARHSWLVSMGDRTRADPRL